MVGESVLKREIEKRSLDTIFNRLAKRNISEQNKKIIKDYIISRKQVVGWRRLDKYETCLSKLSEIVRKDINKLDDKDFTKFIEQNDSRLFFRGNFKRKKKEGEILEPKRKELLSHNTLKSYSVVILTFLKEYVYPEGSIPKKIKNVLRKKRFETTITPQQLLTKEEIRAMLNSTQNIRRKAILQTYLEGAFRPMEFLALRVMDVEFTSWGVRIFIPHSKTKTRQLPLFDSAPLLAQYLNTHPRRTEGEAPLWLNDKGKKFTRYGLNKILKDLAKKSGIKKRIYAYLCRHTQLTEDGKILKAAELQYKAGHSDIKTTQKYIHLCGNDLEEKALQVRGIIPQESKENVKPVHCGRCNALVEPNSLFCPFCGFCIGDKKPETVRKIEEIQKLGASLLEEEKIKTVFEEVLRKMVKDKKIKLRDLL